MSRPRGTKPVRPAPKRAWVMPVIVTGAIVIVVVAIVYTAVNGFLFQLPGR